MLILAPCTTPFLQILVPLILVSNEAVIVVKSDVSGFTSQEDSDNSGALVTLQQSLVANAGDEFPKQNGFGKDKQKEPLSASGSLQIFPPGRIIHMVAHRPPDSGPAEGISSNEIIGIYETPLYDKIRLALQETVKFMRAKITYDGPLVSYITYDGPSSPS
jgi:hypothetical protein